MECEVDDLADAILWPRVDDEDNLLMTFAGGKGELTPFHKELLERALDERVRLVIFDTASDGFGGNEIDRTQVKRFVRSALGSIARAIKGAVVLCAHPSRAGIESGRGDSGSTQWSNAFRSRLYVDIVRDENGRPDLADPDARTLERMKANYASRGDRLNLRWRNGVIVRERTEIVDASDRRSINQVFLSLFKVHAQRQNISPSATANNSAPAIFAKLPRDERDGYAKRDFAKEMDRLLKAGVLTIEEYGKDKSKRLASVDAPSTLIDAPSRLIDA
jgi:RecA-family ATPase